MKSFLFSLNIIGTCLTSSLPDVRFKSDKESRKGIEPGHIPWMVQLHSSIHCAGAIISPEWVVSSAQCFLRYTLKFLKIPTFNISIVTNVILDILHHYKDFCLRLPFLTAVNLDLCSSLVGGLKGSKYCP